MASTHRRTVLKLTPSNRFEMQAHLLPLPLGEVEDDRCFECLLLREDDLCL